MLDKNEGTKGNSDIVELTNFADDIGSSLNELDKAYTKLENDLYVTYGPPRQVKKEHDKEVYEGLEYDEQMEKDYDELFGKGNKYQRINIPASSSKYKNREEYKGNELSSITKTRTSKVKAIAQLGIKLINTLKKISSVITQEKNNPNANNDDIEDLNKKLDHTAEKVKKFVSHAKNINEENVKTEKDSSALSILHGKMSYLLRRAHRKLVNLTKNKKDSKVLDKATIYEIKHAKKMILSLEKKLDALRKKYTLVNNIISNNRNLSDKKSLKFHDYVEKLESSITNLKIQTRTENIEINNVHEKIHFKMSELYNNSYEKTLGNEHKTANDDTKNVVNTGKNELLKILTAKVLSIYHVPNKNAFNDSINELNNMHSFVKDVLGKMKNAKSEHLHDESDKGEKDKNHDAWANKISSERSEKIDKDPSLDVR